MTIAAMDAATTAGVSCSHTRTTRQPAAARAASFARSLSTFLASLGSQYSALDLGDVACSGHECQ